MNYWIRGLIGLGIAGIGIGLSCTIGRKILKPRKDDISLEEELRKRFEQDNKSFTAYENEIEEQRTKLDDFVRKDGASQNFDEYLDDLGADIKKSIELARSVGVPEDKIIKSMDELDEYFLG